jgi:hypothetical protein
MLVSVFPGDANIGAAFAIPGDKGDNRRRCDMVMMIGSLMAVR